MTISQNEPSQQLKLLTTSSYDHSAKQKHLMTDIGSIMKGSLSDLYLGAMELFSGSSIDSGEFQQQSLYVALAVMGCSTQDYLNLFPNHWFICIGESGSRKTLANQIIKNTLIQIDNKCYPINMPASREGLYTRLNWEQGGVQKPSVIIEFDEGLTKLSKLWANQRPETNGSLTTLMETLLGAFGAPSELGEITNKDPAKSSKAIINPRIALTVNGQGISFSRALDSDTFLDNGFYHRCLVFDFLGDTQEDTLDDYLSDKKNSLLIMDKGRLSYLNKILSNPALLETRGATPSTDYNFKNDYYELLHYLNINSLPLHASAIIAQHKNRMPSRIRTMAWLHAWGRGAKRWETVDVTFAYMVGGLHYQNILNRLKHAPLDDTTDFELMSYICHTVTRRSKEGKLTSRKDIQSLCSRKKNFKHMQGLGVSNALKELEAEGYLIVKKLRKLTIYEIGIEKFDPPPLQATMKGLN